MNHCATHNQPKPRIEFIDTAKGICILLVVALHSGIRISSDSSPLDMLRMPFYFTLSGLFFKNYGGILPTVIKKCNKILIPFLFFYTISYLILAALMLLSGKEIGIPFTTFITSTDDINYTLWFLAALFCINIIFTLLHRISDNMLFLGISAITLSAFSLSTLSRDMELPFYIDSAMAALPFFFLGYCLRRTAILSVNGIGPYSMLVAAGMIAIAFACSMIGDKPYIVFGTMTINGNPILFFIGAAAIVIAAFIICKRIGPISYIRYIGRYSLIILGTHALILGLIETGLNKIGIDTNQTMLWNVIFFTLTISICISLIKPLTTWFPKFTAQQDLITWSPRPSTYTAYKILRKLFSRKL